MPKFTAKKVSNRISSDIILAWADRDLLRNKIYLEIQRGQAFAYFRFVDDEGVARKKRLHVAVAERHVPRPGPEFEIVEALDGNKLNCDPANLEWRTKDDTDYKRRVRFGVPKSPFYRKAEADETVF